jgi:hypothetical protein
MPRVSEKTIYDLCPGMERDMEIVDLPNPVAFNITLDDGAGAVRMSPSSCTLARSLKRIGFSSPLVFKTVCYIPVHSRLVYKGVLDAPSRRIVRRLDREGVSMVGIEVTLVPPTGKQSVGGRSGDGSHGYRGRPITTAERARRATARAEAEQYSRWS